MAKRANSEWEDLADIADKFPEEWSECRRRGHDPQPLTATVTGNKRYITERCSRGCGVEIDSVQTAQGEYVQQSHTRYTNPEFLVKGRGRQATYVIRCTLRARRIDGALQRGIRGNL